MSASYAAGAEELKALLGAVQAGAWKGPGAEAFLAAHVPYLAWLIRASANSAQKAAQHEAAAAAYITALSAMPTLAELAANHVIHDALLATNFFGINAIPITLNEADYAEKWFRAAITMATYQAVSAAAMASTSPADPAPPIVKSEAAGHAHHHGHHHHEHGGNPSFLDHVVAETLRTITGGRINWDPAEATVNGIPYDEYVNASEPMWWLVRALELSQNFRTFAGQLFTNPVDAFRYIFSLVLFDWPTHIAQIAQSIAQSPQLLAAAIGGAVSHLGAVTGFAGLAGLGAIDPAVVSAVGPPVAAPIMVPVVGSAPPVAASASAAGTVSPSAPAPAPSTVASASPAPPPAAGAAGGFGFPFLVGGGPGIGFGSGMSTSAGTTAKRTAAEPDSVTAVAAAAAREQARRRRRRRAALRENGIEVMDMDVELDPDSSDPSGEQPALSTAASDQAAGNIGFAGTVRRERTATAAGLTALAGDEFGGGPKVPMVPGTWNPHPDVPG